MLRGRDVKRYKSVFADLWLIGTFPSLKLNIDDFPSIKKYLEGYLPKIKQTGEIIGKDENGKTIKSRKKTGNKWFETQDQISYYKEFIKEKIVWTPVNSEYSFHFINGGEYFNNSLFMIGAHIAHDCIVHKTDTPCLKNMTFLLGSEDNYTYASSVIIEKIPIPKIATKVQILFEKLVDEIIEKKKNEEDATVLEHQLDIMVYKIFTLTYEEVLIVDEAFPMSEVEYNNFEL